MKILHVGVENRVFLGSAGALKILGHETFYLCPIRCRTRKFEMETHRPEKTSIELFGGFRAEIPRLNLSMPNSIIPPISWINAIHQGLKHLEFKPHIILFEGAQTFHFSYFLSTLFRVPLVLYIQSIRGLKFPAFVIYNGQYSEILRAPMSILHHIVQSRLAAFTITSEAFAFRFLGCFLNNRIRVIEPTFASLAPKNGKHEVRVDVSQPYALTILRLGRVGGVEPAQFRILTSIARKLPELTFVAVGASRANAQAASINVPCNMKLTGEVWLDEGELASLYKGAICIVNPILLRAQSNRFLEALFYGKPVITTSNCTFFYKGLTSGEHAIIEDCFNKYPYRIREILNDKRLRDKLETGAKRFFSKTFSPLKHAKSMETLLEFVQGQRCK